MIARIISYNLFRFDYDRKRNGRNSEVCKRSCLKIFIGYLFILKNYFATTFK